jgi:hypothetical protein
MMFLLAAAAATVAQPTEPPEIVAPPPVAQAPGPAAAEPTAEMVAEAMKLVDGPDLRDQLIAGVMIGLNDGVQSQLDQTGGGEGMDQAAADRIQEALLEEFKDVIDAEVGDLRREAALLYARRFTLDELRELNRVMDLPVFKKMERLTPVLTMEMMDATMRLFAPHMEQLLKRGRELYHEMMDAQRPDQVQS